MKAHPVNPFVSTLPADDDQDGLPRQVLGVHLGTPRPTTHPRRSPLHAKAAAKVRPKLVLITPALAEANNGNWQTARRWASMLEDRFEVRIQQVWDQQDAAVMLALHAHRSAASVAAFRQHYPDRPIIVVLTGTDVYAEFADAPETLASIQTANRLIVLQSAALARVRAEWRDKTRVCLQSTTSRRNRSGKPRHWTRAVMVGHLRAVKRPETFFALAELFCGSEHYKFDHIGRALEPRYEQQALALQSRCDNYRWLGDMPYETTRRRIQAAHVLVHASVAEGAAHVIMEAVCSGTPVLASAIEGNIALLGDDYPGLFELDDVAALAELLKRCREDRRWYEALQEQATGRASLFSPEREARDLNAVLDEVCAPTAEQG